MQDHKGRTCCARAVISHGKSAGNDFVTVTPRTRVSTALRFLNSVPTPPIRPAIISEPSSPALAAIEILSGFGVRLDIADEHKFTAADHALALQKDDAVRFLGSLGSSPAPYRRPGRAANARFTI